MTFVDDCRDRADMGRALEAQGKAVLRLYKTEVRIDRARRIARKLLEQGFGGLRKRSGEIAFEDGDYVGFVDGFGDVVVHAGFETALAIALHGVGRHGDDDDMLAWIFGA